MQRSSVSCWRASSGQEAPRGQEEELRRGAYVDAAKCLDVPVTDAVEYLDVLVTDAAKVPRVCL